ncbi:MAG: hypothetical protein C4323_08810 [Mastigocladus sp. ERB_26_2]
MEWLVVINHHPRSPIPVAPNPHDRREWGPVSSPIPVPRYPKVYGECCLKSATASGSDTKKERIFVNFSDGNKHY